jgi:hypothetical protein
VTQPNASERATAHTRLAPAVCVAAWGGHRHTAPMAWRKSREDRVAQQAELARQDREHADRLSALSNQTPRVPRYCQRCEAKLKPTATKCHYCSSEDLGLSQPSCPLFSVAAPEGKCSRCGGASFRSADVSGMLAAGGLIAGGAVGATIGALAGSMSPNDLLLCVTCGARYRRG